MWNAPSKRQLAKLPKLYETESVPLKDKIIHLHFFIGSCDWYIAEFDTDEKTLEENYVREVFIFEEPAAELYSMEI